MNFARDVVDRAPAGGRALIELARDGRRREWTFGEVADASARLAGRLTRVHGLRKGDLVLMVIGNRPEWVVAMVACFRIGAIALPCNEQLRAKDLRYRFDTAGPKLILADDRNASEIEAAAPDCPVEYIPFSYGDEPAPPAELEPTDPCLITFTSEIGRAHV